MYNSKNQLFIGLLIQEIQGENQRFLTSYISYFLSIISSDIKLHSFAVPNLQIHFISFHFTSLSFPFTVIFHFPFITLHFHSVSHPCSIAISLLCHVLQLIPFYSQFDYAAIIPFCSSVPNKCWLQGIEEFFIFFEDWYAKKGIFGPISKKNKKQEG